MKGDHADLHLADEAPGDEGERVYCFGGKSASCVKESDMSGCICPGCPVQEAFKFEKMYYCVYGRREGAGRLSIWRARGRTGNRASATGA